MVAGAMPEALASRDASEAVDGEGGAKRARGIFLGGPKASPEPRGASAPACSTPAAPLGEAPPTAACRSSTMGWVPTDFTKSPQEAGKRVVR
jgi:hypothetical protein